MRHLFGFIIRKKNKKIKHQLVFLCIFWHKGVMYLENRLIYPIGTTSACRYAADFLQAAGEAIVDHPTPEVTHLLLDVPSFSPGRGGNAEEILRMLPHSVTVVGGQLDQPFLEDYKKIDLLKEEGYLAGNAAITADCALQVAAPLLSCTVQQANALVIGWGRIGKCLAKLLKVIGNDVTVAARKQADRTMLQALGYRAVDTARLSGKLWNYRIIFNTAPEMVLTEAQLRQTKNCVKIDLASRRGLGGDDVVWARGLPGVHAPESAGELMARTILRKLKEEVT